MDLVSSGKVAFTYFPIHFQEESEAVKFKAAITPSFPTVSRPAARKYTQTLSMDVIHAITFSLINIVLVHTTGAMRRYQNQMAKLKAVMGALMLCLCLINLTEVEATPSDNPASTGLITCSVEVLRPCSSNINYNPSLAQGRKTEFTAGKPLKK